MDDPIINPSAVKRLQKIHALSSRRNSDNKTDHNAKLLEMIRHHAREIQELYEKKDPHYLTEAGDLAVLCCELLLEAGESIDTTLLKCFERFESKLKDVIKAQAEEESSS